MPFEVAAATIPAVWVPCPLSSIQGHPAGCATVVATTAWLAAQFNYPPNATSEELPPELMEIRMGADRRRYRSPPLLYELALAVRRSGIATASRTKPGALVRR